MVIIGGNEGIVKERVVGNCSRGVGGYSRRSQTGGFGNYGTSLSSMILNSCNSNPDFSSGKTPLTRPAKNNDFNHETKMHISFVMQVERVHLPKLVTPQPRDPVSFGRVGPGPGFS